MTSLGIDIGGTSVKSALLRDGVVIARGKSSRFSRPGTDQLIEAIRQAVSGMEAPDRVGLCCPGLLDRSQRRIVLAVNVPGLVGISLDELVARAMPQRPAPPPAILSDASAVGFDIWASNKLTGRLLCLAIGTGVGAAVIENGAFVHVTGESPGHIGQFDVSLEDLAPIGPDGGSGSLEAYIGAAALAGKNPERLQPGDAAIRALVRAIRICHAIYRPNHVCLAGGVGTRLASLASAIHAAASDRLTSVAREGWTLFCAEHDHHAACGAARWAERD